MTLLLIVWGRVGLILTMVPNDVLYVPGLVANLLSVYQMTHTRSPKKFIFSPNEVEISEILNDKVIAKCVVDHNSKVYKFSHLLPF